MTISRPCPIVGRIITNAFGRTTENQAATVARHLMDLHLLDLHAAREEGSRRLYYDPRRQQHWELVYTEGEGSGEGPPSLIPLADDDVKGLYGREPLPRTDRVEIRPERYEDVEGAEAQIEAIIEHLIADHFLSVDLSREDWRLYQDPVDGCLYEIGRQKILLSEPTPTSVEFMHGPLSLIEVSYSEVLEQYKCLPPEVD